MELLPILGHHVNVRKYVGFFNCLNIVNTSSKNYFQYAGVPLNELINKIGKSLATKLSIVPLKLHLTVPVLSVLDLIWCIAKFIDERKLRFIHRPSRKDIICI